jgi:hypothetical protein
MRTISSYFGWNSRQVSYDSYAETSVMLENNFFNAVDWIKKDLIEEFSEQALPCQHAGCYNHLTHPCESCGRIQGKIPKATLDEIIKTIESIK